MASSEDRFLFVDLDALLAALKADEDFRALGRRPRRSAVLDAQRFTDLLDDQRSNTRVALRRGTFMGWNRPDAQALEAAGWRLAQKSSLHHRTLDKLLTDNLQAAGVSTQYAQKTLVLALGDLKNSTKLCVEAYLGANWRVHVFSLQADSKWPLKQLRAQNPRTFRTSHLASRFDLILVRQPQGPADVHSLLRLLWLPLLHALLLLRFDARVAWSALTSLYHWLFPFVRVKHFERLQRELFGVYSIPEDARRDYKALDEAMKKDHRPAIQVLKSKSPRRLYHQLRLERNQLVHGV